MDENDRDMIMNEVVGYYYNCVSDEDRGIGVHRASVEANMDSTVSK